MPLRWRRAAPRSRIDPGPRRYPSGLAIALWWSLRACSARDSSAHGEARSLPRSAGSTAAAGRSRCGRGRLRRAYVTGGDAPRADRAAAVVAAAAGSGSLQRALRLAAAGARVTRALAVSPSQCPSRAVWSPRRPRRTRVHRPSRSPALPTAGPAVACCDRHRGGPPARGLGGAVVRHGVASLPGAAAGSVRAQSPAGELGRARCGRRPPGADALRGVGRPRLVAAPGRRRPGSSVPPLWRSSSPTS